MLYIYSSLSKSELHPIFFSGYLHPSFSKREALANADLKSQDGSVWQESADQTRQAVIQPSKDKPPSKWTRSESPLCGGKRLSAMTTYVGPVKLPAVRLLAEMMRLISVGTTTGGEMKPSLCSR